jgi:ATP-binding cassette subfamily B protein
LQKILSEIAQEKQRSTPTGVKQMVINITAKQVASFVIKMVRPYPASIAVMIIVAFVWAIDLSVRPYILKIILDRATDAPSDQIFDLLILPAAAYFFMSFAMSSVFRLYGYFVEIKMIPRLRQRIANTNFGKLIDQSHTFYQNSFSGGLANKINDLTYSVPEILHMVIDSFLSHFLALAIAIFTLWQVNSVFAVAMLIWSSLFIGVSLVFAPRLTRLSDNWSEISSTITGKMVDVLSNILSVRLFARKKEEGDSLNAVFETAVKAEQKLEWAYFWIFLVYGYSFVIYLGFTLYFLIKQRQLGLISIGDFALVLGINIAIVDFLWQLTKDFSHFSQMMGKATQALRTMGHPIEIVDSSEAKDLMVTKGEIRFEKVKFHYKGTVPLFENKTITIKHGEKVGLVGYSGSGKTTFVNLILRLYDVSSGRILIDDQDISQITQNSLRRMIGMIPQDPSLFNRTLMDNIRYGRADATDKEVIDASKRAHAHEFIQALPLKYESFVGERGVKLSGGQRQRISVARAILKNAPILMLDEATSQLDTITERLIQDSLWDLMQDKTTLVIAHRLSTLLHMDRILVFDKGKIVEDGNHEELLAKKGLYDTLWKAQIGGFLPEDRLKKK